MTRIQILIHHFNKSFVVKQTLASIQILFHEMFPSKDICENFVKVTYWFPKNTTSKNAFLTVCLYLDAAIGLHEVNSRAPFGGKIGTGDSLLHNYLKFSKVLRMHAISHDAHGFMRSVHNVGPGYVYTITTEKYLRNSMLLGHIWGILFWTLINFLSDSSKVFLVPNGRLFQLKESVSKIFVLIAMNDAESTRSSGYYSELYLKQEQNVVD